MAIEHADFEGVERLALVTGKSSMIDIYRIEYFSKLTFIIARL